MCFWIRTSEKKFSLLKFLSCKSVQTISAFILGGIFIYASVYKVLDPHEFARTINNYKLLPNNVVPIVTFVLAWTELIFGILLILGIYPRVIATVFSLLLVIFMAAYTINLARGLDINCGCFSQIINPSSYISGELVIIRDIVMLIPGIIIILYGKRKTHQ